MYIIIFEMLKVKSRLENRDEIYEEKKVTLGLVSWIYRISHQRCSVKKFFLKIRKIHSKTLLSGSKVAGLR